MKPQILIGVLALLVIAGCTSEVSAPQSNVRVTERLIDFQDGTRLEVRCSGVSKYSQQVEYINVKDRIYVEKISESGGLFKTLTIGDSVLKTRIVYPNYYVLLPYTENISKLEPYQCFYVEPFKFNITDEGFKTRETSCKISYSECYDSPENCLNDCFSQGKVIR